MSWYVATIADRGTLEVLLDSLRAELERCRAAGKLDPDAQAYVVGSGTVVEIYVNRSALDCLDTLGALAFLPAASPSYRKRGRPLIEPASG